MQSNETIAAISTPPGRGAIGIVRLSGPAADKIAGMVFRFGRPVPSFESCRMYHGRIVSPRTGRTVDEVMVSLMRAPRSYTGEDTLEIYCHGGPVVLQSVLDEVIRAGARPAGPGEFTARAFLNGRIDLAQAEAVIDLISASSSRAADLALSQLQGTLSSGIRSLRDAVLDALAPVEALVDFPDEEIETDLSAAANSIESISGKICSLLNTYNEGRIAREGLDIVIAGRTNVGKSSLLNRLVGRERVIVTPLPGTTRDFIEETVTIRGIPVRITDTAGIRDSSDAIERRGMEMVWDRIASADAVLVMVDGSEPCGEEDIRIMSAAAGRPVVPVINKSDLAERFAAEEMRKRLPDGDPVRISAVRGDGMEELEDRIITLCMGEAAERKAEAILTNARHKALLEKARDLLSGAMEGLSRKASPEFVALDLREAADALGEIIGETAREDVLDRIFSRFCIGK
ncbi:MAG TPA: tRNA uridine-5-carboxymethylaminomethyl(34) synthesis GTPase MnmE [Syntrophales bacterium]|nr:tRNA uridine-5-carboxymethylaminomethyl(34) synthesis GTPase MnmE [Syntrophales bacterium]